MGGLLPSLAEGEAKVGYALPLRPGQQPGSLL